MRRIWRLRTWKWPLIICALFILCVTTLSDSWFAAAVTISLGLIIATVWGALLFMQLAFWTVRWIKYGHPFSEETQPYVYKVVHEKKQKAWCIICKEHSGCRVRRNKTNGLIVHVIR
jgi:hypothetical protein